MSFVRIVTGELWMQLGPSHAQRADPHRRWWFVVFDSILIPTGIVISSTSINCNISPHFHHHSMCVHNSAGLTSVHLLTKAVLPLVETLERLPAESTVVCLQNDEHPRPCTAQT